jgi:ABC-type xylose transport system permease subunit
MSGEKSLEVCLNCGKQLKDNESEFCDNCDDMLSEENFSYFPRGNELKKYLSKVKSKINLKKYNLTILSLFGLLVYIIFTIQFQTNFIVFEPFTSIIYTLINIVVLGIGIFGSIYLNINRSIGSILLVFSGFLLFLIVCEFYWFFDDILVYLQYIGSLIVFATGIIGLQLFMDVKF